MLKKNIKRRITASVILFSFVTCFTEMQLLSQIKTGNVMGYLFKKNRKDFLGDAQVILISIKNKKMKFASNFTDEKNGIFKIANIPVGDYHVEFRYDDKIYSLPNEFHAKKKSSFFTYFVRVIEGQTTQCFFAFNKKKNNFIPIGGSIGALGSGILVGKLIKEEEASPTTR